MNRQKIKDLKFIILFIILVSISLIYLFQSSYAKYRKQVKTDIEATIAGWNILINNEDIKNKKVLTNNIIPTFENNEYVKADVLAPGTTGYCDININAKNVDVSFSYELTTIIPEESIIKDLKITGYTINPSNTNTEKLEFQEGTTITGQIEHNTENTTIRLYIMWDDGENAIMDNTEDTNAAISELNKAIITTSLKFSQIKA